MELKYFDNNKYTFDKISCIKDGHFFDPYFKHEDESTLYGFNKKIEEYKYANKSLYENYLSKQEIFKNSIKRRGEIKWMRILDPEYAINKEEKYNNGEDDDKTILQGNLGNCYFIAYLYILKEYHYDVFISLIKEYEVKTGYVEIVFYIEENNKRERKIVVVDDFIPFIKEDNKYIPLFSHYKNYKLTNNRVFLLIEKAYAKINGSYFCIDGNKKEHLMYDYMVALTGVDYCEIELSQFIKDYAKENNIEYENKDISDIIKDWAPENNIKVLKKLKNISDNNSIFLATHTCFGFPRRNKNEYGIFYGHMYAYIKGNEENRNGKSEVFFWTYNPQGKNDFEEINHYEFENINEENKKGLKNGIIILNFFRFFKSFRKMRYQNRNLVNINYNINKFISNLDLLSNLSIYKKKYNRKI